MRTSRPPLEPSTLLLVLFVPFVPGREDLRLPPPRRGVGEPTLAPRPWLELRPPPLESPPPPRPLEDWSSAVPPPSDSSTPPPAPAPAPAPTPTPAPAPAPPRSLPPPLPLPLPLPPPSPLPPPALSRACCLSRSSWALCRLCLSASMTFPCSLLASSCDSSLPAPSRQGAVSVVRIRRMVDNL